MVGKINDVFFFVEFDRGFIDLRDINVMQDIRAFGIDRQRDTDRFRRIRIFRIEPDIPEWKVMWVLGSITMKKLLEVMAFQQSYFIS